MNRVLLVDDHAAFREPLAFMFDQQPDFEVVAQAGSLAEARRVLDGIDLAVVDLSLPDGNGTELIGELRAANPHGMVLVLTASAQRGAYARAVEAGAARVLNKSASIKDVIEASRRLAAGETALSTDELVRLAGERDRETWSAIENLTPREQGDRRTVVRRQRHGAYPRREHLRQTGCALEVAGTRLRRAPRPRRHRLTSPSKRLSGIKNARCPQKSIK